MLETYALMVYHQHTVELVALLHSTAHAVRGYAELAKMLRDAIADGARAGVFRRDVPPATLASFCTNALAAATTVDSAAAAKRLAAVALAALTKS